MSDKLAKKYKFMQNDKAIISISYNISQQKKYHLTNFDAPFPAETFLFSHFN